VTGLRISIPGPAGRPAHDVSDHLAHAHGQPHDHTDEHSHGELTGPVVRTVRIEQALLAKNDDLAARNRGWLADRDMAAVNLMSSPGAGKTTLLERTILESAGRRTTCVIEGDQETLFDAERIKATGAPVVQINTGAGCHLDADMLRRGLDALDPPDGSLLLVENVGNLVCPALFDLGESAKVVIISVTEGDDKPLKYPHMFAAADLVLVNKTDLLPYVDFDLERCARDARSVNPKVVVLPLSVRTGEGMESWQAWLDAV
jgi:hydrogenase nickel incorporation protein HypB